MSGGHFNDGGYDYYKVSQFADELESEIENNFFKDDWGYFPGFNEEVVEVLKAQLPKLREIATIMKHIDYLYSGDYGEETFLERMKQFGEEE